MLSLTIVVILSSALSPLDDKDDAVVGLIQSSLTPPAGTPLIQSKGTSTAFACTVPLPRATVCDIGIH